MGFYSHLINFVHYLFKRGLKWNYRELHWHQGGVGQIFQLLADEVKDKRESIESIASEPGSDVANKNNGIQSEELLQNIKALTEDGIYSVRFEVDEPTNDLVINLIDQEGEVISRFRLKKFSVREKGLQNSGAIFSKPRANNH